MGRISYQIVKMAKAGSVVSMEATGAGTKSAVDVEALYTKQNCIGRSSDTMVQKL